MRKLILLIALVALPGVSLAAEQAVAFYNWDHARYLSFGDPAQVPITFYMVYHEDEYVSLRYVDQLGNSRYVTAENDGRAGLHATTIGRNEIFRVIVWADGAYSLQSIVTGNFLVMENDGTINVNRQQRGAWESFHPQAIVETSPTNRQLTPFLPLHHPEFYVIDAEDRLISMNVRAAGVDFNQEKPTSGHHIGTGFANRFPPRPGSNLPRVFTGAAGEFYGIEPNGNLIFYHYDHSKGAWRNPVGELVGSGWNEFVYLSGDGLGSLYGLHTNGHLYRYKHQNGDKSKWLEQKEDLGSKVTVSWQNNVREYPWAEMRVFSAQAIHGDIDAGADRSIQVVDMHGMLWTFTQHRTHNGQWTRIDEKPTSHVARYTAIAAGRTYFENSVSRWYGTLFGPLKTTYPGRPILGYSARDTSVYSGIRVF